MSTIRSETEESSDSDIDNDDFLMGDGERANNLLAHKGGPANENPFDDSDDESEKEHEMEEMDLLKNKKKKKNKKNAEAEIEGSKEEEES